MAVNFFDPLSALGVRVRWEWVDAGVAGFLLAFNLVGLDQDRQVSASGVVFSAVLAGAVAIRRRFPAAMVLVALLASAAYDQASRSSRLPGTSVAIVLVYYALGRRGAVRDWFWSDLLLLLAPIPEIAAVPSTAGVGSSLLVDVASVEIFFVLIPYAAGRLVAARWMVNDQLRLSNEQLERDRRDRAERSRAAERVLIAREVHDVIAHSMSVMVIQTAAARRVAAVDPETARRALTAVEECGRDALIDLRRIVGVVHREDSGLSSGAATPGIADLSALAERISAMGVQVRLRIDGERRTLTPALDLVVFRVVQEALTNALKYAGPVPAVDVAVTFEPRALRLDISDSGPGSRAEQLRQPMSSGGQGLVGMRERVAMFGGEFAAGPADHGGFQVHAVIPIGVQVPV